MKRKILLIEDNEQNTYLVTFLLERSGNSISHAATGPVGLKMAQEEKFDLILLDLQLPEMDGYTVARELRKITFLRDIPIIAVTSYAMAGDREKALDAGCTGYIEKPIDPETFEADIERQIIG